MSVIESTMPKSRKTALAIIFDPKVLFMLAYADLPSSVLQFKIKLSSLLRIMGVLGIVALIAMRLLDI